MSETSSFAAWELISADTAARMRIQRQRNVHALARCAKQRRKNEWYLKWFGWFPMTGMVRDLYSDLLAAIEKLEIADHQLDPYIGDRND